MTYCQTPCRESPDWDSCCKTTMLPICHCAAPTNPTGSIKSTMMKFNDQATQILTSKKHQYDINVWSVSSITADQQTTRKV